MIWISRSSFFFPPFDWIKWIFCFKLYGIPSKIRRWVTVFVVGFKIEVVVSIAVIVYGFNIFGEFCPGSFQSDEPVLAKLFQLDHETFALVIDKFGKRSCNRIIIINFNVLGLDGFSNILLRRFHWKRNVFFSYFYFKQINYLAFCRFLYFS